MKKVVCLMIDEMPQNQQGKIGSKAQAPTLQYKMIVREITSLQAVLND